MTTRELLREYLEAVLLEGRWDDVKARADSKGMEKYSSGFLSYKAAGIDPRYAELFWKHFVQAGGDPLPSTGDVKPVLDRFEELVKIKPEGFNPDISKYEGFWTLSAKVGQFKNTVSKTQEKKKAAEGSQTVYSDANWVLTRITTKEASCAYGRGTKWCISATEDTNYFDQYASAFTDFWFLISKKSSDKWALVHDPEGRFQIYDSSDNQISKTDLAEDMERIADQSGEPIPEELSGHLQRIAGITLTDRMLMSPSRVLTSTGPPIGARALIMFAIQAKYNPEKFTPKNLESLAYRISYLTDDQLRQTINPGEFDTVREFLATTGGAGMSRAVERFNGIRPTIMLKDASHLSDEEVRSMMYQVPISAIRHIPWEALGRVTTVLAQAENRTNTEERTLYELLANNFNPANLSDEVILHLAEDPSAPEEFRTAIERGLAPFLREYQDEHLIYILKHQRGVKETMELAPPAGTPYEAMQSRPDLLQLYYLARDLEANEMDPIRVALKRLKEQKIDPGF